MRHPLLALALAIAVAAIAGCSSPAVPDITYYRLPEATALPGAAARLFREPFVVDTFNADGLYADQALIYALDAEAHELRQYHYQLWTDPPTRMLQRRLIGLLRGGDVAPLVTDELPASRQAVRISGVILRMERVPSGSGGYSVAVALKLRADDSSGNPMVENIYRRERTVEGTGVGASVDAMGKTIDEAFGAFWTDLAKYGELRNG